MDMKRILQAMDGVATKPVVGANDMAKFLSIVDKNASIQLLQEGSNPHKVSLPVQMAMQHYQKAEEPVLQQNVERTGIRKFFTQVEEEVAEERTSKQQLLRQYSQQIAERVLMKESYDTSDLTRSKVMSTGPGPQDNVVDTDGRASLGLGEEQQKEDASSTMHPTRRYRMMRRISKRTGIDLNHLELASDEELHDLYREHGLSEMAVNFNKDSPLDSEIHSHNGVNPASIRSRMLRAGRQLVDLAEMAKSDDPRVWQHLANLFPELEMNVEQVRHGIEQLAEIKRMGGRRSANIPTGLSEDGMAKPAKPMAPAKPHKVKTIKAKKKTSPCRDGQVQTGVQTKNGKIVPKCSVR